MKNRRTAAALLLVLVLVGCTVGPATAPQNSQAEVQPTAAHAAAAETARPILGRIEPSPTVAEPSPTPEPTALPPRGTSPPPGAAADVLAGLEGLEIDRFFEESYKQILIRNPEYLTSLGLARSYGLWNDRLNDLSEGYRRETQELEAGILDLLRSYERSGLTPEQQVSYDVYEWYLDDRVQGHEFADHNYPLHQFLGSYQDELIRLLTELQPMEDRYDAEDYVSRLSQVDDQVAQLLEGLQRREEGGVVPPKFIVEMTRYNLMQYLQMRSPDPAAIEAESLSVYTVFGEKLEAMEGLSAEERAALLDAARQEVEGSFVPAYMALLDYLDHLGTVATDDAGIWKLPDGERYYAYLLRHETSTDLTAQEIHDLGLAEVARIQAEMRQAFDELGYPPDANLGELMERATREGGYYETRTEGGKERLIEAYEALLDEVDGRLDEVFAIRPEAAVIVVGEPTFSGGGYYVQPSLDGSRPGAFHTGIGGSQVPKLRMPTTAYHEAIPGHHFQMAIAQEQDLPLFRNDLFFNGYGEGWALYAERLAWDLGLYEEDPYGNLGRLQLELLRAVRLVVDTGIHAMKWTREEAKAYMNEALGDPSGGLSHEVDRYIVWPAQATGYKVGMLEILALRQRAMEALGERFDLKGFHNVVVGSGSLPLEILARRVEEYIAQASAQGGTQFLEDAGAATMPVSGGRADPEPISAANLAQVARLYAFAGHKPGLAGLAFLGEWQYLASVNTNFSQKLWDLAQNGEARPAIEHGERIFTVAFSPDGSLMAGEGADGTIKLWDVESGEEAGSLAGHGCHLMSMAFSPDGRLLASAGADIFVKLWDVESGEELQTLVGHITPVTALAFSPDGKLLASGSARFSTVINLWDVESGRMLQTLVGHTGNVHSLAFSPDGKLLASAAMDRSLRLWRVDSGRLEYLNDGHRDPIYGLAFSPDGSLLASSGDGGSIDLRDASTGRTLQTLEGHKDYVSKLAFSPDGSLLASGGIDDEVFVWGVSSGGTSAGRVDAAGTQAAEAAAPAASAAPTLTRCENGLIAFSSYRWGESKIFTMNADGSDLVCLSRTNLRDTRPAWSPDGTKIAYVRRISHSDHEIYVMDADGGNPTRLTNRPDSIESEPTWSPDGTRIAFISNERLSPNTFVGRFHVWVMNADGSDPTLLTDIGGANSSPDWSPDGRTLAFDSTRDGNYEVYVINADGSEPVNLTQHPAHDTSPAWSPDGTKIAFVSDREGDQEIYVMNADGTEQTRLTDRFGFGKGPTWSPDGQYILFYGRDDLNKTQVYKIRADGSELVQLTSDADFDGFPSWQPRPGLAEIPEPAGSLPSIAEAIASLKGLPVDRFFDESFKLLLLRDPEWVTAEGLAGRFETGNDRLTDLSDAYVRDTQQLQAAILDLLRGYDREALTAEQQISYDVYEWYLDDLARQQAFMYYDYPVTHFTTGVQYQTIQFFSDLHPVTSLQDARDYVACLSQVDDKFKDLIEGLRLRQEAGVILPRFLFPWLMGDVRGIAHGKPQATPFYTAFEEKLSTLDGVSAADKRALLGAAEQAIQQSVIPAFSALEGILKELEPAAPDHEGVWQFSRGSAYYEYVLRHHTTTDLTPDEIYQLGLEELERIHGEMRAIFDELGYPEEESIPKLYARVAREGGYVSGGEVAERYEAIIQEAEGNLGGAFDVHPQADVIVVAGPQGDYYVSASLDGSRPGAFYARTGGGGTPLFGMPTLAYHEAVPGHHFQIAIAQESDLPLFRNVILFTGYAEGWALYAEELAHELGWYEDDPYGELGRLQAQAFRAARLVVDTGLHARGWTFDQALDYMVENTGQDPGFLQFEVSRYIAWPGQAAAYMVGMLKIKELRQEAMDRLGERFDLKDFHRVVLANGSMPLEVLERVVEGYIEAQAAR